MNYKIITNKNERSKKNQNNLVPYNMFIATYTRNSVKLFSSKPTEAIISKVTFCGLVLL